MSAGQNCQQINKSTVQDETVQLPTRGLLNLAAMSIPLGVVAAIPIIYAFRNGDDNTLDYRQAVYLQGDCPRPLLVNCEEPLTAQNS